MKTLRYKKIGDFLVFEKFDTLPIDPVMTQLANQKIIKEFPEQKAVNQKIAEKFSHEQKRRRIKRRLANQKIIKEFPEQKAVNQMFNQRIGQHSGSLINSELNDSELKDLELIGLKDLELIGAKIICCNEDLSKLNASLKLKIKDVIGNNPIYSHPRKNEVELNDQEYQELSRTVNSLKNEKIALDISFEDKIILSVTGKEPIKAPFPVLKEYNKIADFRGSQYFWIVDEQWQKTEIISTLGVTKSDVVIAEYEFASFEYNDLSPQQIEEIRIQELSSEEKEKEKEKMLATILSQAAIKKSELEIQDDPEALKKSQTWYKEQAAVIEGKYN